MSRRGQTTLEADGKKTCGKCSLNLPLSSFSPGRGTAGRRGTCRACRVVESRNRYLAKRAEIIARVAEYRSRLGSEYSTQHNLSRKTRIARKPAALDAERERNAKWRSENPDRAKEFQRRYRESKRSEIRRKTKARAKALTDDVVVSVLFAGVKTPPRSLIPPALIGAKREHLRITRELRLRKTT